MAHSGMKINSLHRAFGYFADKVPVIMAGLPTLVDKAALNFLHFSYGNKSIGFSKNSLLIYGFYYEIMPPY